MVKSPLKFILVLTLGLVVGCAHGKKDKQLAYGHFKMGATLLHKGEKEKALSSLIKARDLDPDSALIRNHLGLAYYFAGEYEHAIIEFKESLDIDPNYSEAHNNLGRTYIDIKNYQLARFHLNKAATDLTYPNKDKVWLNIGLSFFRENRFTTSEKFFLKSIGANRDNCLAYNYYGRSLVEREKFKKAAKTLDQAIYHCRKLKFDEPHYYSGISLFRIGYKSKAIARLQEGRKLYPNGPTRKKIDEMINLMQITDAQ